MSRILYSFFLLFITLAASAQEYLGTWTSHLPYNKAFDLAVAGEKIFCSTQGGLFYYNKADNSINKFSKEDGLSDSEISTLAWSAEHQSLVIAYKNANIDIVEGNNIINLPDIKRKQVLGDKNIYHIDLEGDLAYLSCGFGIVVLDIERKEIRETYLIGPEGGQLKINSTCIFNDEFYAASDEGLFYADLNSPNLADFNNWEKHPRFNQETQSIPSMISGSEGIYMIVDDSDYDFDSLYRYIGTTWELYPWFQQENLRSLDLNKGRLTICSQFHVDVFDSEGENIKHIYTGRPLSAEYDEEDIMWVADEISGLIKNPNTFETIPLNPNGPPGITTIDLEFESGLLLGAAGGTTPSLANLYLPGEIYIYRNKEWSGIRIDTLRDLINLEIDPNDTSHYFAGSWGYGLLEFRNGELVNHFTNQNSSLQTIIPGDYYYRLGGIVYDNHGNLWISNSAVSEPLSVFTRDRKWYSFPINEINTLNLGEIIITQSGYKWIILPSGNGLFVYDDNGTIENADDDEMKKFSVLDRNNKIITNEIYSIAEDRKGNIWLGTNEGILVYYSPSRVFSGDNFYAQKIIIPRNDGSGLGDPLLGTESVNAIEVDGANRKWLGTRNGGVFLVSEDGLEEVHAFNTDNSPLLSNTITDIAINDETGEVYFATSNGIISFISDATEPDDIFRDVYVYPNPVREDYEGSIVVSGLVEDTYVKITDINGNLVYETRSLGGQAVWNGKNLRDERVATGVYLVFCTTEDGLKTHITKLLFIH